MHKSFYKIVFIVIAAIFLIGLIELLSLRFQKGDVYPAYSSLRADPLGSKVILNSLGYFKNLDVKRNYQPFERVAGDPHSILLYLGAGQEEFQLRERSFFHSLDQYVIQGGELVIAFLPTRHTSSPVKALPVKQEKKSGPIDPEEAEKERNYLSMEKHWGIGLDYVNIITKKDGEFVAKKYLQTQKSPAPLVEHLPSSVPWHSTMSFNCFNGSWHILYTVNGEPVMVEKTLGRGSMILMSDAFPFSNEALLKDRQVPLLGAIFQDRKEIIFDEYHLGVINRHGIIDLIVQYRLHFFFLSLFVIFILLVWKNASLAPQDPQDNTTVPLIVSKKDYVEGLASLLRKNIPRKDILTACIDEWSQAKGTRSGPGIKKYVEEIASLQSKGLGPMHGYQLIYKKLTEGTRKVKI